MSQVDVVIPVYNTPIRYVRDALNSVSQQSFEDWTTIVVNDGSAADYSLELESLIEEFAERRIRYLRSENRGLAAARNLGISSGKAPFVALLASRLKLDPGLKRPQRPVAAAIERRNRAELDEGEQARLK